jgi:hypothetical protein
MEIGASECLRTGLSWSPDSVDPVGGYDSA